MWTAAEDKILLHLAWALTDKTVGLAEVLSRYTDEQCIQRLNHLLRRPEYAAKPSETLKGESLLKRIAEALGDEDALYAFKEMLSLFLQGEIRAEQFLDKVHEFRLTYFVRDIANGLGVRQPQKKIQLLEASYMRQKTKLDLLDAQRAIRALILKEREGQKIDGVELEDHLHVFVKNGRHAEVESFILQDTTSYYSRKASRWIKKDSCRDYMLKCEECLKKEKKRVSRYLHLITESKLVEKVQYELLVVFAQRILENEHSGCRALLRDDKFDDLSRIYRLYHPMLEPVADLFKQHVTAEGNALIKQGADTATCQVASTGGVLEQVLIRKLIALRKKYMIYVKDCFQSNSLFHKALKEAFEIFCNKPVAGVSSAELFATFCDNFLKKGGGSEKLSDEAVEETIEQVVELLVYLSGKDFFFEFYWKKLAHRLLFNRSGNEAHETSVLTKFSERFKEQSTSKMFGMVKDMALVKEYQNDFRKYVTTRTTAHPGIDLTVTILTTGIWPSYKTSALNLPTEMVKCLEVFKSFYETKNEHKRLSWNHSLGTCEISGHFEQNTIELVVSTYQAALLLLFNEKERLSYTEIREQLDIGHEDVVRLLHSLSCAKYKILVKEPFSTSILETDTFEFNSKFNDKKKRIKVALPPLPPPKEERKKTVENVDRDRRYGIDAALVRIMKSRKVMGHQQLVAECVEQLSQMFKPDIKMIKNRIEDLISREFLERDSENPNKFKYVA